MTTMKHSITYSTISNIFRQKLTKQIYMIPPHMQQPLTLLIPLYLTSIFDSYLKTSTNRTPSHTLSSIPADTTQIYSLFRNRGLIVLGSISRHALIKLEYQTTPNSIMSYRTSHQNTNQMSQHISPNTILAGPFNPDRISFLTHLSYYWKSHSNLTLYMQSTYTTQVTPVL